MPEVLHHVFPLTSGTAALQHCRSGLTASNGFLRGELGLQLAGRQTAGWLVVVACKLVLSLFNFEGFCFNFLL